LRFGLSLGKPEGDLEELPKRVVDGRGIGKRLGNFGVEQDLPRVAGARDDAVIFQDRIADHDAFVAYIGSREIGRIGDQLPDDLLLFVAEGTA
jgi:hypothetical protein